jgi:hypothetical protein
LPACARLDEAAWEAAIWAVNFRKAHELLPDFLRSILT